MDYRSYFLILISCCLFNLTPGWILSQAQAQEVVTSSSSDVSFQSGSQYKLIPISGVVSISCPNLTAPVQFNCRDIIMDPADSSYLVGPTAIQADLVSLRVLRSDGTQRIESQEYSPQKGRSTAVFSLWKSGLIGRPLLREGLNTIEYNFTRNGQSNLKGSFQVTVARGDSRTCPSSFYNSPFPEDCASQYTVCQNYFEQNNFCNSSPLNSDF